MSELGKAWADGYHAGYRRALISMARKLSELQHGEENAKELEAEHEQRELDRQTD